jgi:hypothetical protein
MSLLYPDAPAAPFDPLTSRRSAWPRHHRPLFDRLLGTRIEVNEGAGRSRIRVPLPMGLVLLAVGSALSLGGAVYGLNEGPINPAGVGLAAALALPMAAAVIAMLALAGRSPVLEATNSPARTLTLTRRTLKGFRTETFHAGQIDSMLIVERRDLKNRRIYSLELCTDDERNRELYSGYSPAELERAARALRMALAEPAVESTGRIPLKNAA